MEWIEWSRLIAPLLHNLGIIRERAPKWSV